MEVRYARILLNSLASWRRRPPTLITMNSSEARSAREFIGLTSEQLAAALNVIPSAVAAWEDGRIVVPRHIATELAWRSAAHERQVALDASGLQTCSWIQAFESESYPSDLPGQSKRLDRVVEHTETCELCAARDAFITERFAPMPPAPRPGWLAVVVPIAERIAKLPRWAQAPATGAVLFASYSLFKLLILLPSFIRGGAQGLLAAGEGIAASASIGALLGLFYGFYRRRRDAAEAPEKKAALDILDSQMSKLRAERKGGGAVYDAYLRQRRGVLKGTITAEDLLPPPAESVASPGPRNDR
jgi:hypothetical protein